jgi:MOSC domain-containing protein YiiM
VRKAGIMSVVRADGRVRPGDPVAVELPRRPHHKLEPV